MDISKAYDGVEWGYLRAFMLKIGFVVTWVDMIMMCLSLVSFSMLVNNKPLGPIIPIWGLRQGDPRAYGKTLGLMEKEKGVHVMNHLTYLVEHFT